MKPEEFKAQAKNAILNGNGNWRAQLLINKSQDPKASIANAMTALRHAPDWQGVLGFNEFALETVALSSPPWESRAREWTDHEDRLTTEWLHHQGIFISVGVTAEAVQTAARDHCFHPVRDYLSGLKWDGTQRIDTWLTKYLGVPLNEYTSAVGARWLISAVARIYRPGCKADCCLILEGEQGKLKSTALQTITGKQFFTDEIADLGSKDSAMQTHGVWIIEIAELDSMARSEASKIKAFLSRSTDRYRPPYGRRVISSDRQCVFAGTVNLSTYLRDETGNRRFWPVECRLISIPELERDRDQLWAEAFDRYQAGSIWWLDTAALDEMAAQEQADRYEGDPWEGLVSQWVQDREDVSVEQILLACLHKPEGQWLPYDKQRVGRILRHLGWRKLRVGTRGMRDWKYKPRPAYLD